MAEFRKRKLPNDFLDVDAKRLKVSDNDVKQEFFANQVVKYDTTGDGNCFFHAVFGDNSSQSLNLTRMVHTTVTYNARTCHSPVFFLDSSIGFMVDTNERKLLGNGRKMIMITC